MRIDHVKGNKKAQKDFYHNRNQSANNKVQQDNQQVKKQQQVPKDEFTKRDHTLRNHKNPSDEVAKEKIKRGMQELTQQIDMLNKHLEFKVHDETEEMMVSVIDTRTDEVVKTIPPKELLDLAARIRNFVGLVLDESF